jgi:DNA-directed RNA polymerase subunit RPC12/RpoP
MNMEEYETLGYFIPRGVEAVCLSCRAKMIITGGYDSDAYIHIKENYKPLEDIECDQCGDMILPRGGWIVPKRLTTKKLV